MNSLAVKNKSGAQNLADQVEKYQSFLPSHEEY